MAPHTTAKDSFLKNTYLIFMTFSHLPNYNEEWPRCILNAALTCKDFLDLALNVLWKKMYSWVPLLKLLPALQVEDDSYVCANVHVTVFSIWPYFVFRSLEGMFFRKIGIDCNITLEESSLCVSIWITMISRFILRLIFKLLNFGHLLSFHLFVTLNSISPRARAPISFFSCRHSLIRLNSTISLASKILLLDHLRPPFQVPLRCSGGLSLMMVRCRWTFKKNILSTSSSSDL